MMVNLSTPFCVSLTEDCNGGRHEDQMPSIDLIASKLPRQYPEASGLGPSPKE